MKLIEITPDWILKQLPHRLISVESNESVELCINTLDSCWFKLALNVSGIKYDHHEYTSDDKLTYSIIKFSIGDMKDSCPSFYALIKETASLKLIKGSDIGGKYFFKN